MVRRAAIAAGFALCLLAAGVAHRQIPPVVRAQKGEHFVPRPEVARAAALGFDAALADWYWLQAVQVVGATVVNPAQHGQLLGRLVDVVTTLDPWVDHPYRFAAVWLTETEREVRTAVRLLERGIQYHPDDWRNFFHLGFDHFYYLEENARAARRLEQAAALPGSPAYLPRLVARLRAQSGSTDLDATQIFLQQLAHDAEDEYVRSEYLKAMDEVETERRARMLDAAREAYRRRNGRDIERVADLAEGPGAVLRRLPPELHGWGWELDDDGRIVSSYYGRRYEVKIGELDRQRRERWRRERGHEHEQQGGPDAS